MQLGEAIHSESAAGGHEGDENIRLADTHPGVSSDGYMLANTEGDDGEIDDEDEEQRVIQSEMNGDSQMQHSVNNLGGKAGINFILHLR